MTPSSRARHALRVTQRDLALRLALTGSWPTLESAQAYLAQHDDETARDHVEKVERCMSDYQPKRAFPLSRGVS